MSGLTVRSANEADLPALAALDFTYLAPRDRILHFARSGQVPEHTFRFRWRRGRAFVGPVYDTSVEGFRQALSRAELFLVAEVEGELAGSLMLMSGWPGAGEITDLAVHAPHRRRGVATALLDAACRHARSRGWRGLHVEPRNDYPEAIAFYAARGFRLCGFNDRLYSNDDDERQQVTLFMFKELE